VAIASMPALAAANAVQLEDLDMAKGATTQAIVVQETAHQENVGTGGGDHGEFSGHLAPHVRGQSRVNHL